MLHVVAILLALPLALCATYLLVLTLFSARGRPAAPEASCPRFTVVVPAHDEAASIAATLHSLGAVIYPPHRRRIVVVADNCSDGTAEVARAAGAEVIERSDRERRGKGYALEMAFDCLLAEGETDAFVVVDADTTVSPNLLLAFAERLARGASVVQARYRVRNVRASWRTELMTIALAMYHDLRSLARERLRVSCGLRGNGMCFAAATLRQLPHRVHGLVEDVEYAVELALRGVRVHYAHGAEVHGEMPAGTAAAATQRQRWESGRAQVRRSKLRPLLARAVRARDPVAAELAADLLTPPLATLVAYASMGLLAEVVAWACGVGPTAAWPLWTGSSAALLAYVGRGLALSGLGLAGVHALLRAPGYIAWKLLRVARRPADSWVRTARDGRA
ncbi:MAG: glycosyltransferase family 2 protein [Planctomycetota bacterium]